MPASDPGVTVRPTTHQAALRILARRGLGDLDVDSYLAPTLRATMPDPSVMTGLDDAVDAIVDAVRQGRRIVLFGDYDADGMCSVALFTRFLEMIGHESVGYVIPDRLREGYGPTAAVLPRLRDLRPDLVLVLDSGTAAGENLARLAEDGIRVVALDHHQPGDTPPPWSLMPAAAGASRVSLVNPALLDGVRDDAPEEVRKACAGLCATGVSFMTAIGVRRALREHGAALAMDESEFSDLMAYVAIATVADVVPLLRLNRALVANGMRRIPSHPGLAALARARRLDPTKITATQCAFSLAPCLNAAGRIADPRESVDLLLCREPIQAMLLSNRLIAINDQRRALQDETMRQAEAQIQTRDEAVARSGLPDEDCGLILEGTEWHPGIVGLIAGRLAERTGRVVVVAGADGAGSARAPSGFDIGAFIVAERRRGVLIAGGGHAAAAGFRIAPGAGEAFADAFRIATAGVRRNDPDPDLILDKAMAESLIGGGRKRGRWTDGLTEMLGVMQPFGKGNPPPNVMVSDLEVEKIRVFGGDAGHAELTCKLAGDRIGILIFDALQKGVLDTVLPDLARPIRAGCYDALPGTMVTAATGLVEPPWRPGVPPALRASLICCLGPGCAYAPGAISDDGERRLLSLLDPDPHRLPGEMASPGQVVAGESDQPALEKKPAPPVFGFRSFMAAATSVALLLVSGLPHGARAAPRSGWTSGHLRQAASATGHQLGGFAPPAIRRIDAALARNHGRAVPIIRHSKAYDRSFTGQPGLRHGIEIGGAVITSPPAPKTPPTITPAQASSAFRAMLRPKAASAGTTPAVAAPRQSGVPLPPSPDCLGNGIDMVLSPSCLARISSFPTGPAPSPPSGPATILPMPSFASVPSPAPLRQPLMQAVAPGVAGPASAAIQGVQCTILPQGGRGTRYEVADSTSCLRAALGLHPMGTFSVVLVDAQGHASAVACGVTGGRQVCTVR